MIDTGPGSAGQEGDTDAILVANLFRLLGDFAGTHVACSSLCRQDSALIDGPEVRSCAAMALERLRR